jgi:hypothetical protein
MRRLVASSLLLFSLAACGTSDSTDSANGPLPTSCPQVAVIRDLSVYQYPPAADESNLVISARMGNIKGGCSYDEKGNMIEASFQVASIHGANTAGHRARVPFFISVLDASDNVVRKEVYEIPVVFEGNSRETYNSVPINPRVALPSGADASQYRVFLGFQLTKEQVDANHRFFEQFPKPPPIYPATPTD